VSDFHGNRTRNNESTLVKVTRSTGASVEKMDKNEFRVMVMLQVTDQTSPFNGA